MTLEAIHEYLWIGKVEKFLETTCNFIQVGFNLRSRDLNQCIIEKMDKPESNVQAQTSQIQIGVVHLWTQASHFNPYRPMTSKFEILFLDTPYIYLIRPSEVPRDPHHKPRYPSSNTPTAPPARLNLSTYINQQIRVRNSSGRTAHASTFLLASLSERPQSDITKPATRSDRTADTARADLTTQSSSQLTFDISPHQVLCLFTSF